MGGVAGVGLLALGGAAGLAAAGRGRQVQDALAHNEFEFRLQPPPRGLILDRNGVVLASNRPDFRLLRQPATRTPTSTGLLDRLPKLMPLDDAHRARLLRGHRRRAAPRAGGGDRGPDLGGVLAHQRAHAGAARRHRRHGRDPRLSVLGAFAHVVGYVAKVIARTTSPRTGPNSDPILLNPGFRIGKQGIEKTYDLPLRGKPGAKKVEVDVKGRVVREDPAGDIRPSPAQTLPLTLDADIQNRALEVFGDRQRRGGDDGLPHRRRALPALGAQLRRQPLRQGPDRRRSTRRSPTTTTSRCSTRR